MDIRSALVAISLAGMLYAGAAGAQVARSGGGDAQRATQQLQQLAAERTALQAENERLKRELADLRSKATGSESAATSAKARVSAAEAAAARAAQANEQTTMELEQARAKLTELVAQYRKVADNLRTVEAEKGELAAVAAASEQKLKGCVLANDELYKIVDDVLDRYERVGFGDVLSREEPFTGIARARVQNLVDEYRAMAAEQRLAAPGTAPTP